MNRKGLIAILFLLTAISVTCKGQGMLRDSHQTDSIMRVWEWRYGNKHPWRNMSRQGDSSSVVLRKTPVYQMNSEVMKMKKGIHGRIPSSVFSHKDEMMWAKDYHFSTFLSDILIGR